MSTQTLSDKALSILAFAAFHSLASGEAIGEIVVDDGAGHTADPDGLAELTTRQLLTVQGTRARLTETGSNALRTVLTAIRASQQ